MNHKTMQHILIQTYGCQMNVYDTEVMWRLLKPLGYQPTSSEKKADIILLNTCAIREKAEQKVFSYLGRLALMKQNNPQLIIGVCGCIAQNQGKALIQRAPCVDFIVGTHAIFQLPLILNNVRNGNRKKIYVDFQDHLDEIDLQISPIIKSDISGFVTIMRGCNNYCAYCVVPYVRGKEMSRASDDIINEIKHKVAKGMREVTLLGQNVNSYGKREGMLSFSELLSKVNEIEGLYRIRFTTSHPKDLGDDLIDAFAHLEKLCKHIHLPVQSGSDHILKRMNRKYTRKDYLTKIEKLKKKCPNISITSDFIVGFPGESHDDFCDSISLIKEIEYDSLFAFQYSDRDIAPASNYFPKVEDKIKRERLIELLDMQSNNTIKQNTRCVGQYQSVLVEGKSKRESDQWTGRTSGNKIVNFIAPETIQSLNAMLVDVYIEEACAHSLRGYLCQKK